MPSNSLELLRSRLDVDIDQLDPVLAAKLGPFVNMTSNQALVLGVATQPGNEQFVRDVVVRAKKESKNEAEGVDLALDLIAVLLAKPVLPHVTSFLHFQVSPRYSSSASKTAAHARRIVALAEAEGIPHSRVCIKIPTTGAGILAAAQLESEGIATLATVLFTVDQAVAAHQAKCHFVAPYFNPLHVHFDGGWVEYANPAVEHQMGPVVGAIVATFKQLGATTHVMPASVVTPEEAIALSTLGVDDLTLPPTVLEGLAARPVTQADLDAGVSVPKLASATDFPDFLANDGVTLDASIKSDISVQERLDYAVNKFGECETKLLKIVKTIWTEV